ncbi:uncharacterized protein PAC_01643 [Phialocephala subalpina]|uniref:PNPLA domain-containing protein n=1 Tax=Phialocephala subalpina TaxID=576137 RepID=A0A1L7WG60_9HELO|nr:uncharacterized protein PAC_01643 [Phialocephala subalpina]
MAEALIAIMLGRLRMDIETCIGKYEELSDAIFQPKRSKLNLFGRGKDAWTLSGAFDSEKLAQEIRNIVQEVGEDPDSKLIEDTPECKTFVCALRTEITTPVRFRSYRSPTQVDEIDCAIWEAGRATSAASSFFSYITIGDQEFTDGATGFNNPIDIVLDEAFQLWPDAKNRIDRLISIGTGRPDLRAFGGNLKDLGSTLIKISTETQNTADRFERVAYRDYNLNGKYFRFNVTHGLGDVGLESSKSKGKIVAATNNYLNEHTVNLACRACALESPMAPSAATQRWYLRQLQTYNVEKELAEIPKPIGSTLRWFLECSEFEDWATRQQNAVLLIVGQPGCGKTVLSAFLYNEFQNKQRSYFACTEGEEVRRKPAMIISSLLHQTLLHQPHLFRYAIKDNQPPQNWSYKQLLDSFDAVINSPDSNGIVCLIDALDECHEEYRKQFTRDLKRIFLQNSGRNVGYARLIVTARENYDDIDALTPHRLNLDTSPCMKKDLQMFVEQRVSDLVALRPDYKSRSQFLVEKLVTQACGMYRLVELLVDELENSTDSSNEGFQQILNMIPGDIAEVYNTIWGRIPEKNRPRAQKIFTWLLSSLKPLTKEEIAIGTALEFMDCDERVQLRKLDTSNDILGDLRRLFGPLIRLGSTIELSHQTVRSHFLRQAEDASRHWGIGADEANASIALACLRFLNAEEFENAPRNALYCQSWKNIQFLEYALRFMSQHVALSTSKSHIYINQIIEFFDRRIWLEKWTHISCGSGWRQNVWY